MWTASNHGISRFPSRWCGCDERKARLALLVLSMLPGTLVLYYGDEIGMADLDVPPEARRDQMTVGDEGRDHARTPMQWDASPSAGFTADGTRPWLPHGNSTACNVAAQHDNPESMLRLCRDLIALRSAAFGGQIASYQQLPSPGGVWAYRADDLVVTANLSGQLATLDREPGPVVASSAGPGALRGRTLAPWAGIITRPPASEAKRRMPNRFPA